MIKLKDILNEDRGAMPKGKWITLSGKALDKFKDELADLINIAYKDIGGHANFKSSADITTKDMQMWHAIDLDDDPQPDALNVYKKKSAGMKSVALGHDGSKKAKHSVLNNKISKFKSKGWFGEVSGKMYDILKSRGVKIIQDPNVVRAVLSPKKIKWIGDGWYERTIGGSTHKKVMVGFPKAKMSKSSKVKKAMDSSEEGVDGGLIKIYNKIF